MADLITTRNVRVKTTLEDGVVALEQMEGHETLGQPFVYELSLVSTDWNIDLSKPAKRGGGARGAAGSSHLWGLSAFDTR